MSKTNKIPQISAKLRSAIIDWVLDCQWLEDESAINEMSDSELVRGINKHYQGGLEQFVKDGE